MIPLVDHWFVDARLANKTTERLCYQMRREAISDNGFFPTGKSFVDHMQTESFTSIGFQGTRGLTDRGIAEYEEVTKRDYKPEPPTMSKADVAVWSTEWSSAIGEAHWKKRPIGCGCKPLKYAIGITQTGIFDNTAAGHFHEDYSGQQDLPLTFKDDGSFTGRATLLASLIQTVSVPDVVCNAKATQPIQTEVTGNVNEDMMHLKVGWTSSDVNLPMTCTGVGTLDVNSPVYRSVDVKTPLTEGFDMSAKVGETRTFTFPVTGGGKFTATATIKQIN